MTPKQAATLRSIEQEQAGRAISTLDRRGLCTAYLLIEHDAYDLAVSYVLEQPVSVDAERMIDWCEAGARAWLAHKDHPALNGIRDPFVD